MNDSATAKNKMKKSSSAKTRGNCEKVLVNEAELEKGKGEGNRIDTLYEALGHFASGHFASMAENWP
jgi:hypothetical protein